MRFTVARSLWLIFPLLVHCSTTSGSEAQATPEHVASSSAPAPAAAPTPAQPEGPTAVGTPPTMLVSFAPGQAQAPIDVRVEVVGTPETRQRGLMFRRQLDADAGMLFVFEQPQQLTFWMHNTYLPLDMIFVKEDMTVLGIVENATPLTDTPRGVAGLARYVVEVNAGFCLRRGLRAGAKMSVTKLTNSDTR